MKSPVWALDDQVAAGASMALRTWFLAFELSTVQAEPGTRSLTSGLWQVQPQTVGARRSSAVVIRSGETLKVGRERVSFGRNVLANKNATFSVQHRIFVNDPWELIAEAIHRAVRDDRTREIAHSFRRQAEDYFRAATIGREMAVRPVLLYYAFLNLSKAYAMAKGNTGLAGGASHGISFRPKPRAIAGSLIRFDKRNTPPVFEELLKHLGGNPAVLNSGLKLGHLLPQILPGHRLWCYATGRPERFLTVEEFEIRHSPTTKGVWLNMFLDKEEMHRIGISERKALLETDLARDFEIASPRMNVNLDLLCFQQRIPDTYASDPAEALARVVSRFKNKIWETAKITSPYRKPYLYCCPSFE